MREIKFRAWHEGNKNFIYATMKSIWINGWQCCEALESPKLPKEENGIFTTQEALENHNAFEPNADWEQSTGLKDKNNKKVEIYEGDIVKVNNYEGVLTVRYEPMWMQFVLEKSVNDDYVIVGGQNNQSVWWDEIEVIGNIHQNPELLKENQ